MKFIFVFLVLAINYVVCNRYKTEMLRLSAFHFYDDYKDPLGFVRQLDLIASNYLMLVKKINNELNMELREASNYDLRSVNDTVNQGAAEIINKMHGRQIVVDLILYQIQFCYKMFTTATAKYTGDAINPLYEDLTFENPMNRMVMYEWVNQMRKLLEKISEIGEKITETWSVIREEINTNAVGGFDPETGKITVAPPVTPTEPTPGNTTTPPTETPPTETPATPAPTT